MFQRQVDELFYGLLKVFEFADDIIIAGFDDLERHHDKMQDKELGICRKANLNLNKEKCYFRCTRVSFFEEVISWDCSSPDPRKLDVLIDV